MGRKASHVALECTLQSHPNMVRIIVLIIYGLMCYGSMLTNCFFICFMQVILGEEVAASKLTLSEIAKQITDAIQARAEQGLNYLNCSLSCVCVCVYWDLISHSSVLFRQIPWSHSPSRRADREYSWSVCPLEGTPFLNCQAPSEHKA